MRKAEYQGQQGWYDETTEEFFASSECISGRENAFEDPLLRLFMNSDYVIPYDQQGPMPLFLDGDLDLSLIRGVLDSVPDEAVNDFVQDLRRHENRGNGFEL